MLSRLIGEDIQLAIRSDSKPGHVKADPGQLEQVIMNLVINARDAMPNGGLLAIETSEVYLTRTPMHHLQPLPAGSYLKLTVTDTGCGMDTETSSHLFEPFFTTKEESKGTGLGLSTVFGIVTKAGAASMSGARWDTARPSIFFFRVSIRKHPPGKTATIIGKFDAAAKEYWSWRTSSSCGTWFATNSRKSDTTS